MTLQQKLSMRLKRISREETFHGKPGGLALVTSCRGMFDRIVTEEVGTGVRKVKSLHPPPPAQQRESGCFVYCCKVGQMTNVSCCCFGIHMPHGDMTPSNALEHSRAQKEDRLSRVNMQMYQKCSIYLWHRTNLIWHRPTTAHIRHQVGAKAIKCHKVRDRPWNTDESCIEELWCLVLQGILVTWLDSNSGPKHQRGVERFASFGSTSTGVQLQSI